VTNVMVTLFVLFLKEQSIL